MTEDARMTLTLSSTRTQEDRDLAAILRARIERAKADYDNPIDRAFQLQALARMERLKAALAGLEAS